MALGKKLTVGEKDLSLSFLGVVVVFTCLVTLVLSLFTAEAIQHASVQDNLRLSRWAECSYSW